jgi:hypothetical protein
MINSFIVKIIFFLSSVIFVLDKNRTDKDNLMRLASLAGHAKDPGQMDHHKGEISKEPVAEVQEAAGYEEVQG